MWNAPFCIFPLSIMRISGSGDDEGPLYQECLRRMAPVENSEEGLDRRLDRKGKRKGRGRERGREMDRNLFSPRAMSRWFRSGTAPPHFLFSLARPSSGRPAPRTRVKSCGPPAAAADASFVFDSRDRPTERGGIWRNLSSKSLGHLSVVKKTMNLGGQTNSERRGK